MYRINNNLHGNMQKFNLKFTNVTENNNGLTFFSLYNLLTNKYEVKQVSSIILVPANIIKC